MPCSWKRREIGNTLVTFRSSNYSSIRPLGRGEISGSIVFFLYISIKFSIYVSDSFVPSAEFEIN